MTSPVITVTMTVPNPAWPDTLNATKYIDTSLSVIMSTFQMSDEINRRSTLGFTCVDMAGTLVVRRGAPVKVYEDGIIIFNGFVDTWESTDMHTAANPSAKSYVIDVKDNHYLADKRSCGGLAYSSADVTGLTTGYIVRKVLEKVLVEEGVHADDIAYVEDTMAKLENGAAVEYLVSNTLVDVQFINNAMTLAEGKTTGTKTVVLDLTTNAMTSQDTDAVLWWMSDTPAGTSITFEASTDGETWTPVEKGHAPIGRGEYTSEMLLQIRITLATTNASVPKLDQWYFTVDNGSIYDGVPITKSIWDVNSKASTVIDDMATAACYWWCIDADRNLWYCEYSMLPSGETITSSTIRWDTTLKADNPDFRNRQWVRGGTALTSELHIKLTTNGIMNVWPLPYPLAQVPQVWVGGTTGPDGTAMTVGIKGIDADTAEDHKDFYWNKGDSLISQSSQETPIAAGVLLYVEYVGQYPTVSLTENLYEVHRMADIEGTSGKVDNVEDRAEIQDSDVALEFGGHLLDTYCIDGRTIEFDLSRALVPGETYALNIPELGLVTASGKGLLCVGCDRSYVSNRLNYHITATETKSPYSWTAIYKKMAEKSFVVEGLSNENIIITQAANALGELTVITDHATFTICSLLPGATTYPSSTTYPC